MVRTLRHWKPTCLAGEHCLGRSYPDRSSVSVGCDADEGKGSSRSRADLGFCGIKTKHVVQFGSVKLAKPNKIAAWIKRANRMGLQAAA